MWDSRKKTLDCDRVHRDAAQKDRISQSVGRNQRWRSHTGEKTWVHCARLRSQDDFPRDVRAIHESPSSRTRGTTRGQHMQAMGPAPDPLMTLSQQVQWINSVTLQPMEAAKWINSVTLQEMEAAVTIARVSRTRQEEVTRLQCRVLDEAIRWWIVKCWSAPTSRVFTQMSVCASTRMTSTSAQESRISSSCPRLMRRTAQCP